MKEALLGVILFFVFSSFGLNNGLGGSVEGSEKTSGFLFVLSLSLKSSLTLSFDGKFNFKSTSSLTSLLSLNFHTESIASFTDHLQISDCTTFNFGDFTLNSVHQGHLEEVLAL